MIEGLKPYLEYKESGVPWLGKVPTNWRTPRLKTVLREKNSRSSDGTGLLLSLTRNRGLISRGDMTEKVHSARTLAGYKLYEPGDIVMNRMQAWSGMFGAGDRSGLVSPDYAVFKLLSADHMRLLLARIKAPDLVSQFALESKGIGSGFNRLYSDKFGAIAVSLPPPDEQAAIVRFADVNVDYLGELFRTRALRVKFRSESKGLGTGISGFMRLYNDRFGAIHIPLPPRKEQDAILHGIGEQSADLNTAIARTEREIALMQEYRTRLTADVVTGKMDVRDDDDKLSDLPADSTLEPATAETTEETDTELEEN